MIPPLPRPGEESSRRISPAVFPLWKIYEEPVLLGGIINLEAYHPRAQFYEWKITPNTNGLEIINNKDNFLVFCLVEPSSHLIYCRAYCDWGYTDWNIYQPLIMEEWDWE